MTIFWHLWKLWYIWKLIAKFGRIFWYLSKQGIILINAITIEYFLIYRLNILTSIKISDNFVKRIEYFDMPKNGSYDMGLKQLNISIQVKIVELVDNFKITEYFDIV